MYRLLIYFIIVLIPMSMISCKGDAPKEDAEKESKTEKKEQKKELGSAKEFGKDFLKAYRTEDIETLKSLSMPAMAAAFNETYKDESIHGERLNYLENEWNGEIIEVGYIKADDVVNAKIAFRVIEENNDSLYEVITALPMKGEWKYFGIDEISIKKFHQTLWTSIPKEVSTMRDKYDISSEEEFIAKLKDCGIPVYEGSVKESFGEVSYGEGYAIKYSLPELSKEKGVKKVFEFYQKKLQKVADKYDWKMEILHNPNMVMLYNFDREAELNFSNYLIEDTHYYTLKFER